MKNDAEHSRRYRETHRDEIRERRRAERQANPEKFRERGARWRQANPGAMAAYGRKWNEANRKAVFDHYGWSCACCGTSDDLTIDHVNGDGREHRTKGGLSRGGSPFHRWLVASGFPDGFQTLCRRCNRSKGPGERCQIDHVRQQVLAGSNGHDAGSTP